MEVEEVGFLLGAGERCIEPAQPFKVDHLFGEVALVDDDGGPLAALAFVGGDGVGEFDLEGLGAGVLLGGLGDFSLAAEVGVVEHHVFEERFHAGAGEARTVHVQGVEHNCGFERRSVWEVLHLQVGCCVAQAVAFEAAHDFLDDQRVTIGDEVRGVGVILFEPMVIVADDHEAVAGIEFLFAPEDATADLLVEVVCSAIGSGDDDYILLSVAVVEVVEEFGQIVAVDNVQIGVVV